MAVRNYNFVVGVETSAPPDPTAASADSDVATYGQIIDEFCSREVFDTKVDDITALKALDSSLPTRTDGQLVNVHEIDTIYKWDSTNTTAPDDDLIVRPDDILGANPGRWLLSIAGSGGGGGGGGAAGIDSLETILRQEQYNIFQNKPDGSIGSGFKAPITPASAFLIADYSSSSTTFNPVWNSVALQAANQNFDGVTGWTAVTAAININTSATKKIGTDSLSWDKDGTGTVSEIRLDPTGADQQKSNQTRLWFWLNMPSVTNFSNFIVRVHSTAGTNYDSFTNTTDYAGNAIATGWNLMFFDLTRTTNRASTGTGWTNGQAVTRISLVVTTSVAGQTYTDIIVDAMRFGYRYTSLLIQAGDEFGVYDSSNSHEFIIDEASTWLDGQITLNAGVAQAYTGGSATTAKRYSLLTSGYNRAEFTSGLSGNIVNTQSVRLKDIPKEELSSDTLEAFAQFDTPLYFYVAEVTSGTQFKVTSTVDYSAQFLTGDTIHIQNVVYNSGEEKYYPKSPVLKLTLTGNSSFGSSQLTFTVADTTGIVVGDLAVKGDQVLTYISVTDIDQPETFGSAMTETELRIDGLGLPYFSDIQHYWKLGDFTTSNDPDKVGSTNMPITGTLSQDVGNINARSISGFTGSIYMGDSGIGTAGSESWQRNFSAVIWCKAASVAATRVIFGGANTVGGATGWSLSISTATNTLTFGSAAGTTVSSALSPSPSDGQWHFYVVTYDDSAPSALVYYDNSLVITRGSNIADSSSAATSFGIGNINNGTNPATSMSFAECSIYNRILTTAEITSLYNAGLGRKLGSQAGFRYRYEKTAQSGQKISIKAKLVRRSSAVLPFITGLGAIKT